jgi:peptidoglycan/LPS O-acetylase OafA/YrhL
MAFVESATPHLKWKRLNGIGAISFGVYLLHFPMQLMLLCIASSLSLPADFFTQPLTSVFFFAVLLVVAAASYKFLEKPAMLALRQRLLVQKRQTRRVHAEGTETASADGDWCRVERSPYLDRVRRAQKPLDWQ